MKKMDFEFLALICLRSSCCSLHYPFTTFRFGLGLDMFWMGSFIKESFVPTVVQVHIIALEPLFETEHKIGGQKATINSDLSLLQFSYK